MLAFAGPLDLLAQLTGLERALAKHLLNRLLPSNSNRPVPGKDTKTAKKLARLTRDELHPLLLHAHVPSAPTTSTVVGGVPGVQFRFMVDGEPGAFSLGTTGDKGSDQEEDVTSAELLKKFKPDMISRAVVSLTGEREVLQELQAAGIIPSAQDALESSQSSPHEDKNEDGEGGEKDEDVNVVEWSGCAYKRLKSGSLRDVLSAGGMGDGTAGRLQKEGEGLAWLGWTRVSAVVNGMG